MEEGKEPGQTLHISVFVVVACSCSTFCLFLMVLVLVLVLVLIYARCGLVCMHMCASTLKTLTHRLLQHWLF